MGITELNHIEQVVLRFTWFTEFDKDFRSYT